MTGFEWFLLIGAISGIISLAFLIFILIGFSFLEEEVL